MIQKEIGGAEIMPVLDEDLNGGSPWFVMPLADKTYQDKIKGDKASGSVDAEPIADIMNGLHNHPPDLDRKVLGWRFGPATRQG